MRMSRKKSRTDRNVLDSYKELTPVVYGREAIKHLYYNNPEPKRLLFEMHWHERMEILRVVSGSLELHLGEKCFFLQPGQAAVMNPRMLHCGYSGAAGVEYHTLMFDIDKLCNGTAVSEKYLKPLERCEVGFRTLITVPEVIAQIDRLAACFDGNKTENPLLAMGIVYEMLGTLYAHSVEKPKELIRVNREFGEILEYISSHFCENISAKTLSEYFNYNETYFCRRFKTLTGFTVMKYIQILRMEEAQRLLENAEEEIRVIASRCGFSDTCYFSNCFKKHFGHTPTEFRRIHRTEKEK